MIKPLKWTGNHHQIQRAEALGFVFYVQPPSSQRGWRWAVFEQSKTIYSWMPCKSEDDGKSLCNAAWRLRLEPFLESAAPMAETVLACDPTTSDLPDGQQGVFRNTSTGKVAKWRNVGGVLHAEEEKED